MTKLNKETGVLKFDYVTPILNEQTGELTISKMEQLKLEEKYSWIDEEIKKLKERKEKYPPDSYLCGVIDGSIATLESIKESKLKT